MLRFFIAVVLFNFFSSPSEACRGAAHLLRLATLETIPADHIDLNAQFIWTGSGMGRAAIRDGKTTVHERQTDATLRVDPNHLTIELTFADGVKKSWAIPLKAASLSSDLLRQEFPTGFTSRSAYRYLSELYKVLAAHEFSELTPLMIEAMRVELAGKPPIEGLQPHMMVINGEPAGFQLEGFVDGKWTPKGQRQYVIVRLLSGPFIQSEVVYVGEKPEETQMFTYTVPWSQVTSDGKAIQGGSWSSFGMKMIAATRNHGTRFPFAGVFPTHVLSFAHRHGVDIHTKGPFSYDGKRVWIPELGQAAMVRKEDPIRDGQSVPYARELEIRLADGTVKTVMSTSVVPLVTELMQKGIDPVTMDGFLYKPGDLVFAPDDGWIYQVQDLCHEIFSSGYFNHIPAIIPEPDRNGRPQYVQLTKVRRATAQATSEPQHETHSGSWTFLSNVAPAHYFVLPPTLGSK